MKTTEEKTPKPGITDAYKDWVCPICKEENSSCSQMCNRPGCTGHQYQFSEKNNSRITTD